MENAYKYTVILQTHTAFKRIFLRVRLCRQTQSLDYLILKYRAVKVASFSA